MAFFTPETLVPRKPISHRFCWMIAMILSLLRVASASGEEPSAGVSLEQIMEAFRSNRQATELIEARYQEALAAGAKDTPWSYPELSYGRESDGDDANTVEHTLEVHQTFDVSGVAGLRREAWKARGQSARFHAKRQLAAYEVSLQETFYDALKAQEAWMLYQDHANQVKELLDAVQIREERGDVSRYDRLKFEREHRRLQAEADTRAGQVRAAYRELALMAGLSDQNVSLPIFVGELLPGDETSGVKSPVVVEALAAEQSAVQQEQQAARREWIPGFNVGGGVKSVESETESNRGWSVSVGIEIPLWNRGKPERQRLEAVSRRLSLEQNLLQSRYESHYTALIAKLREQLRIYGKAAAVLLREDDSLSDLARAGYLGGEFQVIDVLDAIRGHLEDHLCLVELAANARSTENELRNLHYEGE